MGKCIDNGRLSKAIKRKEITSAKTKSALVPGCIFQFVLTVNPQLFSISKSYETSDSDTYVVYTKP